MPDYHIPLLPGEKYHVLSRAVGSEKLFRSEENYRFFLERYKKYISPVADTYCFCLLPNHFHFLVRIKDEPALLGVSKKKIITEQLPDLIMLQFSKLLNSYAKAYNKMYNRKGSLFIDYLRRKPIENDVQFRATVRYTHRNPVHHGYCADLSEWEWSSYSALRKNETTWLLRHELLEGFGGLDEFERFHGRRGQDL